MKERIWLMEKVGKTWRVKDEIKRIGSQNFIKTGASATVVLTEPMLITIDDKEKHYFVSEEGILTFNQIEQDVFLNDRFLSEAVMEHLTRHFTEQHFKLMLWNIILGVVMGGFGIGLILMLVLHFG